MEFCLDRFIFWGENTLGKSARGYIGSLKVLGFTGKNPLKQGNTKRYTLQEFLLHVDVKGGDEQEGQTTAGHSVMVLKDLAPE